MAPLSRVRLGKTRNGNTHFLGRTLECGQKKAPATLLTSTGALAPQRDNADGAYTVEVSPCLQTAFVTAPRKSSANRWHGKNTRFLLETAAPGLRI